MCQKKKEIFCKSTHHSLSKKHNSIVKAYLVTQTWTAHRDPLVFCQFVALYTVGWCCIMTSGDLTLPCSPQS